MLWPRAEGELAGWKSLAPTLQPLLRTIVGPLFLPWSVANAHAVATNAESFTVTLDGHTWTQKPQKYHARSLGALREKYGAARTSELDAVLEDARCLDAMREK